MHTNSTSAAPRGKPITAKSNGCQPGVKPAKPYDGFPLFPHATRRWAKKIRGKLVYFGGWDDPDGALDRYLAVKDDLHAGRKPRQEVAATTVKILVNDFLNAKAEARDAGEIVPRTWDDYKTATDILIDNFGKSRLVADLGPDDFAKLRKKLAAKWAKKTLANVITRCRVCLKFAHDNGLIDRPVIYGSAFKRPSKKSLRKDRASKGKKLFTRQEILSLIDAAGVPLKAMLLLGINLGMGNSDCGTLPISAIDLDAGILDFARPKTGIPRRAALWPETVQAIRDALAERPAPKNPEHEGLVFITKYGQPWAKLSTDNTLAKEVGKLLRKLKINGRVGLGFYTLRHVYRTIADEVKDQPATDYTMGHESSGMAGEYREYIGDDRLRAIATYVHDWLFQPATSGKEGGK